MIGAAGSCPPGLPVISFVMVSVLFICLLFSGVENALKWFSLEFVVLFAFAHHTVQWLALRIDLFLSSSSILPHIYPNELRFLNEHEHQL